MVTNLKSREKKKVIDSLLEGDHVLVHLAPHAPNVSLPLHLMSSHTVTLKLSRKFRGALELHGDHIESHLLFGQAYFKCLIPYDAIWGVTSERGDTTSWLEGLDQQKLSTPTASSPEVSTTTVPSTEPAPQETQSGTTKPALVIQKTTPPTDETPTDTEKKDKPRPKLVRIK